MLCFFKKKKDGYWPLWVSLLAFNFISHTLHILAIFHFGRLLWLCFLMTNFVIMYSFCRSCLQLFNFYNCNTVFSFQEHLWFYCGYSSYNYGKWWNLFEDVNHTNYIFLIVEYFFLLSLRPPFNCLGISQMFGNWPVA